MKKLLFIIGLALTPLSMVYSQTSQPSDEIYAKVVTVNIQLADHEITKIEAYELDDVTLIEQVKKINYNGAHSIDATVLMSSESIYVFVINGLYWIEVLPLNNGKFDVITEACNEDLSDRCIITTVVPDNSKRLSVLIKDEKDGK